MSSSDQCHIDVLAITNMRVKWIKIGDGGGNELKERVKLRNWYSFFLFLLFLFLISKSLRRRRLGIHSLAINYVTYYNTHEAHEEAKQNKKLSNNHWSLSNFAAYTLHSFSEYTRLWSKWEEGVLLEKWRIRKKSRSHCCRRWWSDRHDNCYELR